MFPIQSSQSFSLNLHLPKCSLSIQPSSLNLHLPKCSQSIQSSSLEISINQSVPNTAGNSAFVALAAAEAGIATAQYRTWAVEQINYLLGDNHHDGGCFSFAIGVGSKYPVNPHHRGA